MYWFIYIYKQYTSTPRMEVFFANVNVYIQISIKEILENDTLQNPTQRFRKRQKCTSSQLEHLK